MATKFITPNWRMPRNSNQSKASNYSINFDGSGHLNLNDLASSLQSLSVGSISMWWKPVDATPSSANALFTVSSTTVTKDYFAMYNLSDGKFYAQLKDNTLNNWILQTDSAAFSDDTWAHVVITQNGTEPELYVNGSKPAQTFTTSTNKTKWWDDITVEQVNIGTLVWSGGTSGTSTGAIGPVSVFDYVLSTGSISALYNSGIPSNPLAVTTPPIAFYDLGQGSAYASGSAGIVEPNLAEATGSTVFDFGGTSEVINTNTIDLGNTHTISYWCNVSATSFSNIISGTGGSKILFNSPNRIYYYSEDFTNSQPSVSTPLNQWNNVLISRDSTTIRFYVNGSLKHTTTGFGGNHFTFNKILGLDVNNQLSNLAIWDSSLDASEASTLYNNGTPLQSYTDIPQSGSLKAWYKLGLDTSLWNGTEWKMRNSSVVPTYTSAINYPAGYYNPPGRYPGIGLTDTSFSGDHVTISTWLRYPKGYDASSLELLRTAGTEIYIVFDSGNSGNRLYVGRYAGKYKAFTTNITDRAWHHYLLYFANTTPIDRASIRLFEDGEEITGTLAGSGNDADKLETAKGLGSANQSGGGGRPSFSVSNYALFNTDQTSNIDTIYNNGTPGDISSLNPLVWYKADSANTQIGSPSATSISFTDSSGNNNTGIGPYDTSPPPEAHIQTIDVQDSPAESSGMNSTNLIPSNLIKSIPYSGYSMDFDGTNDYIDFGDSDDFSFTNNSSADRPFVLSWWLKPDSMNQNIGIAIKKDTEYQLKTDNLGKLKVTLFDSTSGGDIDAAITTNNWLYDGAYIWRNIIVTYDGSGNNTGIDIFLDGEHRGDVVRSGSGTYNFMRNSANSLINGDIGTFEFDGKQSNFAVWKNRTMMTGSGGGSDYDSIIKIYNGGSPGNLSNLRPTSWWSLGVDSYFDGSNWICPDLGSGGNNGTSANMAADDLVGDGPDSLANGTSTNLDLGSDLIGNAPGSTGNAISVNMNFTARTGSTP